MRVSFRIRTTVLCAMVTALVLGVTANASGQTQWRPACELIDATRVSAIVGSDVRPRFQGPRNSCRFEGQDGEVILIELWPRATLDRYRGDTAKDLVIAERPAVELVRAITGDGRVVEKGAIVALDGGGTLSAVTNRGSEQEMVELATALLEAILGAGPLSAVPPSRGDAPRLGPEGSMCDHLPLDDLNHVLGTAFTAADLDSSDERCHAATPDFSVTFELSHDDTDAIDTGTYTSEELAVAGRPATWDPVDWGYPSLDVDAGDDRLFSVRFQAGSRAAESLRDPASALAEAVIPRLPTVGAAPTLDCSKLTVDEVANATGLTITSADRSTGEGCVYGVGDGPGWFLVAVVPELDAVEYGMTLPNLVLTEVAGHTAAASSVPGGAVILVADDGLPDMTGYWVLVMGGDFPGDVDVLAAAKRLAEVLVGKL